MYGKVFVIYLLRYGIKCYNFIFISSDYLGIHSLALPVLAHSGI